MKNEKKARGCAPKQGAQHVQAAILLSSHTVFVGLYEEDPTLRRGVPSFVIIPDHAFE